MTSEKVVPFSRRSERLPDGEIEVIATNARADLMALRAQCGGDAKGDEVWLQRVDDAIAVLKRAPDQAYNFSIMLPEGATATHGLGIKNELRRLLMLQRKWYFTRAADLLRASMLALVVEATGGTVPSKRNDAKKEQ